MKNDTIRGAGGKSGGGSSHTPVESPDSLHSISTARILDLISEGQIQGFAHGPGTGLQDIYLNGTPLQNVDGSLNFNNVQVDSRVGMQAQDYIKGFSSVENETAVGTVLLYGTPWVQAFSDLTLSAVRVRLTVPQLTNTSTTTGDMGGTSVGYTIELATDGGAYTTVMAGAFSDKTTTQYDRSHRIDLPNAVTGWSVRVSRTTPTSTSSALVNAFNIGSYTTIVDGKFSYPNSAVISVVVDASQFQQIPTRAYDVKGRILQVPSNYNPTTRQYAGAWDGTFQSLWSDNPAWVYYDLALNNRYGLGDRISASQIDKWGLYTIAQYCDGYVPTGIPARASISTGSVTLAANATTAGVAVSGAFSTGIFTATAHGFAVNDPVQFSSIAFGTGVAVTGASATGIFTATAHGFALNDQVEFYSITGGPGIIPNQIYYVISANLAANTFEVSTTTGGPSITFGADMTAGTVVRKGGGGLSASLVYYVIAANLAANTFSVSATYGGSSIVLNQNLAAGTVTRASNYTRTTGSFVTDGFAATDEINATGFATAGNNGRGVILAVNPLQIAIDTTHPLTSDAAAAARTLATQAPTEPRFCCNVYLQSQADAYKVMQDLATVFRGISYWAGGVLTPVADMPSAPVCNYSNANVIDGVFTYQGSAKKARHTVALVTWNNPANFDKAEVEYVPDTTGIARYGIQPVQITAIGCKSQGQAHRVGLHVLLSERLETDIVSFAVGMDGMFALPGQVVRIADQNRAGRRIGGRIESATTTQITVDAQPATMIAVGDTLIVMGPDDVSHSSTVTVVAGNVITVSPAYPSVPATNGVWIVENVGLVAQQYRVLSVGDNGDMTYTVTGLTHNDSKFATIDTGARIQVATISAFAPQAPVTSITLSSYARVNGSVPENVIVAEWPATSGAILYLVQWRRDNGTWTPIVRQAGTRSEYESAYAGVYTCKVAAVGPNDKQSTTFTSSGLTVGVPTKALTNVLAISAGIVTVDCALGLNCSLLLTANVTGWVFLNVPKSATINIQITQDPTGGRTVAFPSYVNYAVLPAYVATTTPGASDYAALQTYDGGATYILSVNKAPAVGAGTLALSVTPASKFLFHAYTGASIAQSQTFTLAASGGTSPYTYSATFVSSTSGAQVSTLSSGTTTTPNLSYTRVGPDDITETWRFTTTDSASHSVSASVTMEWNIGS